MLVAGIIVSYLMSRYFLSSIRAMTRALQRLSEGDSSAIESINSGRNDEFGDLADKVRASMDEIQGGFDKAVDQANADILEDNKEYKDALKREQESHKETELTLSRAVEKLEAAEQLIA